MTALSVPIRLFDSLGVIVGGLWLITLGMWAPIGAGLVFLFVSPIVLRILLMPIPIFASSVAKAKERGNIGRADFIGMFSHLYTGAVIVAWAFVVLKAFAGMGPRSVQWPLMLISYAVATGPWQNWACKGEDRAKLLALQTSAVYVSPLSVGYMVAMGARLFASASFHTCLWLLIVTMVIGYFLGSYILGLISAEEYP